MFLFIHSFIPECLGQQHKLHVPWIHLLLSINNEHNSYALSYFLISYKSFIIIYTEYTSWRGHHSIHLNKLWHVYNPEFLNLNYVYGKLFFGKKLMRNKKVCFLLTFSTLKLLLKSAESHESRSQFATCSGYKWLWDKFKKVFMISYPFKRRCRIYSSFIFYWHIKYHVLNMLKISQIWKDFTSVLSNLNNFHSLEVVDRVSETQLQESGNLNWIIWRLKG